MHSISCFLDHGVPVEAEENRSAVLSRGSDGHEYLVLFSIGFLLNVDLHARKVRQVFYPDGNGGSPFTSFCAGSGLAYASAGAMLMEFNPSENRFTWHAMLAEVHQAGFALAQDPGGNIYAGSYSSGGCRLFRYDPASRDVRAFGRMDEHGHYMGHLATDRDGWIYMGVGPQKRGLIAFHPATGERRQLCPDEQRTRGSAYVHNGTDGCVYGHVELPDVSGGFSTEDLTSGIGWLKLEHGHATEITPDRVAPPHYYNYTHTFRAIHSPLLDASFIHAYDISEKELVYTHPETGEKVSLRLTYETGGAALSPMVGGSDSKLYGTSNHPMHGYVYDPETEQLTDLGGTFYQEAGGGNICAYAVQGSVIGGAAYYGGKIHMLDTAKPVQIDDGPDAGARNPRMVAIHKEILRPRSAAAHVDGETFIFGGFGENGGTGGGLCIYNHRTGAEIVLQNNDLLKYHSTLCMRVLANGDLIAGTSTASPCGGTAKAPEAELYILNWESKTIRYRGVPVPGEPEIALIELDDRGRVHGITSGLVYFVFDPVEAQVLHRQMLPEDFGHVVRDGLLKGPDRVLYGLCNRAMYTIDPEDFTVHKLAEPPVPVGSGMALLDGRIYFSGPAVSKPNERATHLWSYGLTTEDTIIRKGEADR